MPKANTQPIQPVEVKPEFVPPTHKPAIKGGCTVSGSMKDAAGQAPDDLVFTPAHSGEWQGTFYAAERIPVSTTPDGSFSVRLVPSSVMGRYRVRSKDKRIKLSIEVPEADRAKFLDLIVEG